MREFVLAWIEAVKKKQGVEAVATKCDITITRASARANYLRKKGVRLPAMPRTRRLGASVEELNQLIESRI